MGKNISENENVKFVLNQKEELISGLFDKIDKLNEKQSQRDSELCAANEKIERLMNLRNIMFHLCNTPTGYDMSFDEINAWEFDIKVRCPDNSEIGEDIYDTLSFGKQEEIKKEKYKSPQTDHPDQTDQTDETDETDQNDIKTINSEWAKFGEAFQKIADASQAILEKFKL